MVDVGVNEEAEVEDELIALVLGVGDDDGVAQDAVLGVGRVHGEVAVAEGLAGYDVLVEDVEVDQGGAGVRGRRRRVRGDAARG